MVDGFQKETVRNLRIQFDYNSLHKIQNVFDSNI